MASKRKFQPDRQDEARRRGHGAAKVHEANAKVIQSLERQQIRTVPGRVAWIVDAADQRSLRGIPAIGRSVAGAIAGTNPEREATR